MKHLDDAAVALLRAGWGSPRELAEAQAHAADCAACASRLDPATRRAGAQHARSGRDHGQTLPRGTRVDRYLILQPVGHGGMGVVYAAYDPELDRKVALKLLRTPATHGHARAEAQARLLREGQAMARISHPNVTAVHDVGTFGEQIFVAMDLVEGTDLRHWLKKGERPWRQVLHVLVAAGRGLAAAHAAGLVHRDFKPENVLVGEDGRVQVTDFGLARVASAAWSLPPHEPPSPPDPEALKPLLASLTLSDVVVGTPSYMAPELHQGRSPDARSDQFAFCATLYQALYQKRAFDPRALAELAREAARPEPRLRSSLFNTLRITTGAAPIQPPPREPRVPGRVRRALMRGLSLDPEQRFPSMHALLGELTRPSRLTRPVWLPVAATLLVGAVLVWRPPPQRPPPPPLCGEARGRIRGVWDPTVARRVETAFTATGAPYAGRSFQSVKAALDAYANAWIDMRTEACQATLVRGEQSEQVRLQRTQCLDRQLEDLRALTTLLVQADPKTLEQAVAAAGALPSLSTCANDQALTDAAPPQADPVTRIETDRIHMQLAQARVLLAAGTIPQGLEVAAQAVEAARKLGARRLLAEALLQQGLLHLAAEDGPRSEQSLREAWQVAEEGRLDEIRVRAAIGLVQSLAKLSARLDVAREWGAIAKAAFNRVGRSPELEIPLRRSLGALLVREGSYSDARAQYEQAIALVRRTRGANDPEVLLFMSSIGACDYSEARYAEGAAKLEAALALSERLEGPNHPHAAAIRNNLANMYLGMGDPARALAHAQAAIAILEASMGRSHPMLSPSLNTAATALIKQGRYAESLPFNERALKILTQTQRPQHPDTSFALGGIGEAFLGLGRPREALPYLERALATAAPDPLFRAETRFQLARALAETGGDLARARSLAAQAHEGYLEVGNKARAAEVERWLAARPR